MKFLRYVLPIAVACGFSTSSYADDYATEDLRVERDSTGVSSFIKSKKEFTLQEKLPHLNISGDTRMKWTHFRMKHGDYKDTSSSFKASPAAVILDANNNPIPGSGYQVIPADQYDVEFSVMFEYKADRTWVVGQLGADCQGGSKANSLSGDTAGFTGSGTDTDLHLRKAYIGYKVLEDGESRLDLEMGRRRLYDLFDSKMQFMSRFDGLAFKYSNAFEGYGDFYFNGGAFVVDSNSNHYGFVGEVGLLDVADYGVDLKYSLIDWMKNGKNRNGIEDAKGTRFLNSQFTAAYTIDPDLLGMKAQVYGAFLINHKARASDIVVPVTVPATAPWTDKVNKGWYAGFSIGEVRKEGDYSVDLSYQYCGAQVTPDLDNSGITRGTRLDSSSNLITFTKDYTAGQGNYKGVRLDTSYGITDNLVGRFEFDYSRAANEHLLTVMDTSMFTGKQNYTKFRVSAIYAF